MSKRIGKDLDDLEPKMKLYILGKEIKAVSIQDALRKERNATITEIREIGDVDE